MKLLLPTIAALAATVNAACNIWCPNGMLVEVNTDCRQGGDDHDYHKKLDWEIKVACFEKIDSMLDQGHISKNDAGYWKGVWNHVESEEDFGCSMDWFWNWGFGFDDATHDGCRLHDICYSVARRWNGAQAVDVNGDLGVKAHCDEEQRLNHIELASDDADSIWYWHDQGVSNSAYRKSIKKGKTWYDNNKHFFETGYDRYYQNDVYAAGGHPKYSTYIRDDGWW